MNLIPLFILWSLLAFSVLGLALYRKLMIQQGGDQRVDAGTGEEHSMPQYKTLTICTAAFGLVIVAVFLVQAWEQTLKIK
jgi:hypothetical protein